MPFNRPVLADLVGRIAGDIETELPGTDARLRRSNLGVIARVVAASVHGLYGYLDYIARQVIVDTADGDHLVRWAALFGIDRKAATFAGGQATVGGTNGSTVPTGTLLQRADGAQYATTADATVNAGEATLALQALAAGVDGNAAAGTSLQFVSPVGGVGSTAVVTSGGLVDGADVESDPALRGRVVARMQAPPMGGSASDYVAWALEVPGVTRAWVYPLAGGPGTVTVRFVRDDDASAIPSSGEVSEVQSYIDARRPVTATVTVAAPTALAVDPQITITPDTPEVRAAVEAELLDFIRREGSPGGRLYLSRLREAVSSAAGESDNTVVSPTADVVPAAGQIPTLGAISWV